MNATDSLSIAPAALWPDRPLPIHPTREMGFGAGAERQHRARERAQQEIYRSFRRGESVDALAERFGQSRAAIQQAIAAARVTVALRSEVESHAVTGAGRLPVLVFKLTVHSANPRRSSGASGGIGGKK